MGTMFKAFMDPVVFSGIFDNLLFIETIEARGIGNGVIARKAL